MGKKLYVGNLSYEVTGSDLQSLFEPHGRVESAQVIADRDTGRSKGFGFVELGNEQEAQGAIQALNGREVNGRATHRERSPGPRTAPRRAPSISRPSRSEKEVDGSWIPCRGMTRPMLSASATTRRTSGAA